MPTGASTNEVEDDELVDEQQVTFHFQIEGFRQINAANIGRSGFSPHPADLAGVADFRDEVEDILGYPTLSKNFIMMAAEACHHRTWSFRRVSRCLPVPPTRNKRTTLPMSKEVQSTRFSGFRSRLFPGAPYTWNLVWASCPITRGDGARSFSRMASASS